MRRGISSADASTAIPIFCLRWPEFIGWWRRVPPQIAAGNVSESGSI